MHVNCEKKNDSKRSKRKVVSTVRCSARFHESKLIFNKISSGLKIEKLNSSEKKFEYCKKTTLSILFKNKFGIGL